jgi:hypothetical protein
MSTVTTSGIGQIGKFRTFSIYKPVREPRGSGGYENTYQYVDEIMGTIRTASASLQLVAQGNEQTITHTARLYNNRKSSMGLGWINANERDIANIDPDYVIVNKKTKSQFKVITAMADDEHESPWIIVSLLAVKDVVQL